MEPELLTAPTAELVVGMILALRRRLVEGDAWVRSGRHAGWRPRLYGSGLAGATVGIIGMGRIGRAVATRLLGFDATLVYSDPVPLPEPEARRLGTRRVWLPELLAGSDVVVPLVPLTEDTRHLLNAEALGRMRPGTCVVNASRGSIVDEHAVAEALRDGRLGRYAAEVFAFEDTLEDTAPGAASVGVPPGLPAHPRTVLTAGRLHTLTLDGPPLRKTLWVSHRRALVAADPAAALTQALLATDHHGFDGDPPPHS
jgi:phosphonate dehydrogenase